MSISDAVSFFQQGGPLNNELSPAYIITIDGDDISNKIRNRLISMGIVDNRGFEADTIEIQLDDSDGLLSLPRRGAKLRAFIGWSGSALTDKGVYTVDEIEYSGAPDVVTVRGKSVDLRDKMQVQKECSYHQKTLKDIVGSIAGTHSLIPVISNTIASELLDHIDQQCESDASFLTRLAKQYDAIATVKDGRLLFVKMGLGLTASGAKMQPIVISRKSGDNHRFSVADREAYTGVVANWHDHASAKKKSIKVRRKKKTTQQAADTTPSNVKVNATDKNLLVGTDENVKVLRHLYASKANAQRAALAEWQRLQRGVAEFSITLAKGQPELIPELPVSVSGYKPEIDAAGWILTRVSHQIDDSGYTNNIELEVMLDEIPESEE